MTGPAVRQDYTLTLVSETPLHVGGAAGDPVVDLPLATDGQGRLMVPGTSWAGVLRAFARRTRDAAEVDALFGAAPRNGDAATEADPGHASRLFVSDTTIGATGLEMRTGVGIDRRQGAAATRILYDRMVVPAGTTLTMNLRYEGPSRDAAAGLVAQVRAVGLTVGGASRRGLGRLRCTAAQVREIDLTRGASLLAALAGRTEATEVQPADGARRRDAAHRGALGAAAPGGRRLRRARRAGRPRAPADPHPGRRAGAGAARLHGQGRAARRSRSGWCARSTTSARRPPTS